RLPRLARADREGMPDAARADRRRLGENSEAAEGAGDRYEVVGLLEHELAGEAVELRDPTFAVVAGQARVGGALAACDAVPARATDGRADEIAFREAVAVMRNLGERFVADHQVLLIVGRDTEQPFG